jgi:glutathione S-transferase
MTIALYDLVDKAGNRYSPYGWRIRMALLHKGLSFEVEFCYHSDRKLAFSGQHLVPVLVDGGQVICDSWNIACYLDATYPDSPLLLNDPLGRSFAKFVNKWTDSVVGRPLVRSLYLDIWKSLHPEADAETFRRSREERNGATLEQLYARRDSDFEEFNRTLAPMNALLSDQRYIAGERPAYVDYILFGTLQMPRNLNGVDPLSSEQGALRRWRDELQLLHDQFTGAMKR